MLLYRYPTKKSIAETRMENIKRENETRKLKAHKRKTIIISSLMFIFAIFSKSLLAIILVGILSCLSILITYLGYLYLVPPNVKGIVTEIYDDKLITKQQGRFNKKMYKFTIFFEDIISTKQNNLGGLIIELKDINKSYVEINNSNIKENIAGKVKLDMFASEAKYVLIDEFKDRINYIG